MILKIGAPPHVVDRFSRLQNGEIVMSFTFAELLNGALKKINQLVTILPVQEMSADVAKQYA